jgi:PRC-barrel domain
MKKTMLLASAAMIGVGFLTAHANAQGVPQTVAIAKVDVQKVAAGYRASKVIGSSVLNDANETIGKIDDLLVTRDGKEPYAVLSWWLPGHGYAPGGCPLRQPQVRRQQDCAAGRDKGRA